MIRIIPRAINRRTGRRQVMGVVSSVTGLLDDAGVYLLPYGIESQRVYTIEASRRGRGGKHLVAFFDSRELLESIDENGKVELGVVGLTDGGEYFYGHDAVQITGREKSVGRQFHIHRRRGGRGL